MNFLNSGILGALGLLSIPVIIHLINRRKAVEHKFAAFEFLMRSKIDSVRRLRLKSILLLIIRTLLIACIVLGAAMPVLYSGKGLGKKSNENILVIFDNSASMRYVEQGISGFSAAKDFLKNYIENENIQALKIYPLVGDTITIETQGFAGELKKKMAGLQSTYGRGRFDRVFKQVLKDMAGGAKYDRIMILSDLAETDWAEVKDTLFKDHPTKIVLAQAYTDSLLGNIGLVRIGFKPDMSLTGSVVNVEVNLLNQSGGDIRNFPLSLYLFNKNVVNGFVEAGHMKMAAKSFALDGYYRAAPGFIRIRQDSFPIDDIRYFVFNPPAPVKTLVIDGDQGAHFTSAETFFLERALTQRGVAKGGIRIITPAGFNKKVLRNQKVLFVCNYVPDKGAMRLIEKFVAEGGGLFMSLGNKVAVDDFNARVFPMFKRRIREKKSGFGHKTAVISNLAVADPQHPAVAILNKIENPSEYQFQDLFLLEPAPGVKTKTLLSLSTGEPLMLQVRAGKGNAVLYLSTIDMDWNTFPMRPFFLPFIRETIRFLAGESRPVARDTLYVNDTIKIKSEGVVRIDNPNGNRSLVVPESGLARFVETEIPGMYTIKEKKQGERWFAVNIDPAESNMERLTDSRLQSIFSNVPTVRINIRRDLTGEALRPRPLWHYLFLCALILALVESLICLPGSIRKNK
jgi:hypothetical protein